MTDKGIYTRRPRRQHTLDVKASPVVKVEKRIIVRMQIEFLTTDTCGEVGHKVLDALRHAGFPEPVSLESV